MRRREFITLLGGTAATWPRGARAQQRAMPVVGYIYGGSAELSSHLVSAFLKGLAEAGYVEGRNVAIEYRWAQNERAQLPELAADLVRRRVTVIAALSATEAALAAKAATKTIPIVFSTAGDPVELGLVSQFNRPGGNVTGVATMNAELVPKRIGLLRELLPRSTRFTALINPTNSFARSVTEEVQRAAEAIGLPIEIQTAVTAREIDAVFAGIAGKRIDALLVGPDPLFTNRRVQFAILAARHAVPVMYPEHQYAVAGGLMSYSSNVAEQYRQVGIYTGRILKGEKPADLPVMQPTKFEFVINLQTARALGIEVPPTLLSIADEVIE